MRINLPKCELVKPTYELQRKRGRNGTSQKKWKKGHRGITWGIRTRHNETGVSEKRVDKIVPEIRGVIERSYKGRGESILLGSGWECDHTGRGAHKKEVVRQGIAKRETGPSETCK